MLFAGHQTVASPPQISPVKVPDNLEQGQRLVIGCVVVKGTQPISFSWRRDNAVLVSSSDVKVVHTDSYQEQLLIESLMSEHVGNYTCSARNAFGSDQMSVSVALEFIPQWLAGPEEPLDFTVVQGGEVRLNCSAKGHPKPTMKVMKG